MCIILHTVLAVTGLAGVSLPARAQDSRQSVTIVDPLNPSILQERDDAIRSGNGTWSVFVLRPQQGVKQDGCLLEGEVFVGAKQSQLNRSFGQDHSVGTVVDSWAESVVNGGSPTERLKPEITPCSQLWEVGSNYRSDNLPFLPIEIEAYLLEGGDSAFIFSDSEHKHRNAQFLLGSSVLYESLKYLEFRGEFIFNGFDDGVDRYVFGSLFFDLSEHAGRIVVVGVDDFSAGLMHVDVLPSKTDDAYSNSVVKYENLSDVDLFGTGALSHVFTENLTVCRYDNPAWRNHHDDGSGIGKATEQQKDQCITGWTSF